MFCQPQAARVFTVNSRINLPLRYSQVGNEHLRPTALICDLLAA